MNKIISFSEYRDIYITPSQKIFDPEEFYDNDDNPDWDFFVNTEVPPHNLKQNENNIIVINNINIDEINDSYTEDNQIEPISLYLNFNSYIKILIPFAILFFLY